MRRAPLVSRIWYLRHSHAIKEYKQSLRPNLLLI
jgi:hypothetical protein